MNRHQLEVHAHKLYGHTISWMANVANTMRNPTTKIKGLLFLAYHNRVAPCSGTIDLILIDGSAVAWAELEQYARCYNDDPEQMRMHISQVPSKRAIDLKEEKLHLDDYHQIILSAANAICALDKPDSEPVYGFYRYLGTNSVGTTLWRHPETYNVLTYNPSTEELDS